MGPKSFVKNLRKAKFDDSIRSTRYTKKGIEERQECCLLFENIPVEFASNVGIHKLLSAP